jgi:hypothetical protein
MPSFWSNQTSPTEELNEWEVNETEAKRRRSASDSPAAFHELMRSN